jgi:hypothetical protein
VGVAPQLLGPRRRNLVRADPDNMTILAVTEKAAVVSSGHAR